MDLCCIATYANNWEIIGALTANKQCAVTMLHYALVAICNYTPAA